MLSTLVSYRNIAANLPRALATTAAEPSVKQQTDYYLAHIGEVKSVDDLLRNDRLYRYAMKAFGLSEMAYAKAMVRKLLTEGTADPRAMANRITDVRYKELARTLNFARDGEQTTASENARGGIVDRFVRQTLEEAAGQDNEGVRLALYFQRKAPGITSAYSILADPALLKVVQVAFGISPLTQQADIDRQAKMIESKLHVADLQDPKKLGKFLQRFASLFDAGEASDSTVTSPALTVLTGQSTVTGFSTDLLMSLQKLRR